MLDAVIRAGADPLMSDADGKTLLHHAAKEGSPEQIVTLLGYGLELEAKDRFKETPLHCAARGDRPKNLETLIKAGSDIDPLNEDGRTPLHRAVLRAQVDNVQILINSGADINRPEKNRKGRRALHMAAESGTESMFQCLKDLISAGAAINTKPQAWSGELDLTPLQRASRGGYSDALRALLTAGADIDSVDSYYRGTALHWAAWGRHTEAISILIDAGSNPTFPARKDATPLHWLASIRNWKCLEGELLGSWASRTSIPYHRDPFIFRAKNVCTAIHRLLQAGADIDARTEEGATPLHWAAQTDLYEANDREGITRALIAAGANVTSRLDDGRTPLHLASHGLVKILIRAGADPNVKDNNGGTPLHVAARWWDCRPRNSFQRAHSSPTNISSLIECGAN